VPLLLAGLLAAAWLGWRFWGPVEVRLEASAPDLPFTIEMLPPVVLARPGEVVSVTYRIRNNAVTPVAAYGTLAVLPAEATGQVQLFLTECGGLNTYQNSLAQDYAVVFRVRPAGLAGTQQVVIRHEFIPASPH
jgi:cytochrome c oxidase assembly protein Cox11